MNETGHSTPDINDEQEESYDAWEDLGRRDEIPMTPEAAKAFEAAGLPGPEQAKVLAREAIVTSANGTGARQPSGAPMSNENIKATRSAEPIDLHTAAIYRKRDEARRERRERFGVIPPSTDE
jgi:hypothetical protein